MNKKILLVVIPLLLMGLFSNAKAITVAELQTQISALLAQLAQLQAQLTQIQTEPTGPVAWCHDFNSNFGYGSQGGEVEALQIALEKEGFTINTTEKNSKYFDTTTRSAVIGFQEKYASEILTPLGLTNGTGYVGEITRKKLNIIYGCPKPTSCTDSDLGKNYYTKGQAILSTGANLIDACPTNSPYKPGITLLEAYCTDESPYVVYQEYECPNGCQDGACKSSIATFKNIYPYPSFSMTTDKQSYSKGDIISLSIKRSDGGSYSYYVDLYVNNLIVVKQKLDVSSPTGIITQIDTNLYEPFKSGSSGVYALGVIASGENVVGVTEGKYNTNSTAVNYFAPSIIPTCTDSDGGKNLYVKGTTTGTSAGSDYPRQITMTDQCADATHIFEYYCSNNKNVINELFGNYFASTTEYCADGCVDGVCKQTSGICGDGSCSGPETCTTCQVDCGICVPPAPIFSPWGGEMWQRGTSHVINWTSYGSANSVIISLYHNGTYQKSLTNAIPDSGAWTWNIPADQTIGSQYSIRVSRLSYPKDYIADSNYFSITELTCGKLNENCCTADRCDPGLICDLGPGYSRKCLQDPGSYCTNIMDNTFVGGNPGCQGSYRCCNQKCTFTSYSSSCPSTATCCSGTTRYYYCSSTCPASCSGSENCATKSSTDSDGGDYPYTGSYVTDYTGCSSGSCTSTIYADTCSGTNNNGLTEYITSGSGYFASIWASTTSSYCVDTTYDYLVNCSAGTANCNQNPSDACEINTTNNSNNCGTCGNVCGVGQVCVSSTCVSTTAVSYSLTVTKNGAGSGTITSNPAGIGCGADCTENYSSGTLVTLTATPAAGSTFTGWSGEGCAGTGSCNVAMNASRTVIAFFNTINTGKCTESDGGKNYLLKGTCQDNIISSLINTDFCNGLNDIQEYWCDQDHNWCAAIAGSCSSLVGPGYICKEGACTLAADSFALSVSKSGTSSGTVTSNPAGINCGNICSAYYSSGTLVTLTATPAAGSTFTGWSGVCSGNNPTCVVNVNQAYTPTATFNTTASLESTYKCPDINNDGIVDIFDAIITSNSINKCSGTSGYDARADVDGNNCVTSIDQNFVQKYLDQKAVDIAQCKSVTTTQTKSLSYFEGMLASISNAISEIIQNLMKLRGY